MPAVNEAVWRNGGSSPQKVQCEFGSLLPARSSVEAATTPSRLDVRRHILKAISVGQIEFFKIFNFVPGTAK
jgi:hypothetical protein